MADTQARKPFTCTRRQLLAELLQEALVMLGMARGGQRARLSELASLPDEQLARLRPVVNPAFSIAVDEDQVWASHTTGATVRLFATDETERLAAFNRFDGEHTLAEVGALLAEERGWDQAQGFALARDLFLSLVGQLVCLPKNLPDWSTD